MNRSDLSRFACCVWAVISFSSCSNAQSSPTSALPKNYFTNIARFSQRPRARPLLTILYSFKGGTDGATPTAGLTVFRGLLYGTTPSGGDSGCGNRTGCGIVFSLTMTGTEKILYAFKGGADGEYPGAPPIAMKGVLYGTTTEGGRPSCGNTGCGTVFSMNTSGQKKNLYSFVGGNDGVMPGELLAANGTLYGTTVSGGGANHGTVFSITSSGQESVLYRFNGADGAFPNSPLIAVGGTFYGTTYEGGTANNGTVFSVTISGQYKVLHRFTGGADGANPYAPLISVNGVLYGTTVSGGALNMGTVFSITTTGSEKVVYSFKGSDGIDGAYPRGSLAILGGVLYGTTTNGGIHCTGQAYPCGTAFGVTTSGREHVVYNFDGGLDGSDPWVGLIGIKGFLYGTTSNGGTSQMGSVYDLVPSP